jgi:hypothetical protein
MRDSTKLSLVAVAALAAMLVPTGAATAKPTAGTRAPAPPASCVPDDEPDGSNDCPPPPTPAELTTAMQHASPQAARGLGIAAAHINLARARQGR